MQKGSEGSSAGVVLVKTESPGFHLQLCNYLLLEVEAGGAEVQGQPEPQDPACTKKEKGKEGGER